MFQPPHISCWDSDNRRRLMYDQPSLAFHPPLEHEPCLSARLWMYFLSEILQVFRIGHIMRYVFLAGGAGSWCAMLEVGKILHSELGECAIKGGMKSASIRVGRTLRSEHAHLRMA